MPTKREIFAKGQLTAQPGTHLPNATATPGLHPLKLDTRRDGLLYIPAFYNENQPAALALLLHGAGGDAGHGLWLLQSFADAANNILLAPASRSSSWDIIHYNRFGPDIIFINQALEQTFHRYSINSKQLAIGGFSDGASYALSVGLINGDLFTHVMAFSPGFFYAPETTGKPKIFVSHGVRDEVLPINTCSRKIVPRLRRQGYDVTYQEFEGGHIIPPQT